MFDCRHGHRSGASVDVCLTGLMSPANYERSTGVTVPPGADETELKFRLSGAEAHAHLRDLLTNLGATPSPPQHEENRLYADAAGRLAAEDRVLRLRILDGGPSGRLTVKGPARFAGAVKQREEIEVEVADTEDAHALLEALGYRVSMTYEKEREPWQLGDVEIALDMLLFGHFCEIEGPAPAITTLAEQLGLDPHDAERRSYPELQRQFERQKAKGTRQE